MAYGSFLLGGKDVRMSGQDVRRGTFSHRHAVLQGGVTNKTYSRLRGIPGANGHLRIKKLLLRENGGLGF